MRPIYLVKLNLTINDLNEITSLLMQMYGLLAYQKFLEIIQNKAINMCLGQIFYLT